MQNYFHQQNMVFNEMKEDAIKYMEYQLDGLLNKIIDYTKYAVLDGKMLKSFSKIF